MPVANAAESRATQNAIQFKMPVFSVADALILFAEQTGEQIIFRYDEADKIPLKPEKAEPNPLGMTTRPIEKLVNILKDTGLKAFRNREGTIVIRKDPDFKVVKSPQKNAAPAPPEHKPEENSPLLEIPDSKSLDKRAEELVITGSRLKRGELSSTNLVSTIEARTITRTNTVNIEELLNKMPQIVPSLTGTSNNPGSGIATVDLRGLGPERTLVLINGRRYVPGAPSGVIDLNTIPAILLEKVEVATGGISAVYGADAIAGVVNFKIRDDFEGFETSAHYSLSKDGDGGKTDINLVYGGSFDEDRGRAFLHLGFLKRQSVLQGDRDFSSFALWDGFIRPGSTDPRFGFGDYLSPEDGGVPGLIRAGSGFIAGGRVLGISPSGPHPGIGRFGPDGEALAYDSLQDRYNYAPFNFLQLPQKRLMASFGGHYQLTDRVEIFNQTIFSQNKVDLELAPTPVWLENLELPVENPFLPEDSRAALRGIDWYGTGQIWQARDSGGSLLFNNQGQAVQARQAVDLNGQALWAADGAPIAHIGAASEDDAGKLLFLADGRALIPNLFRRMTELGPRQAKNNRRSINVVFGIKAELSRNWQLMLHYNFSQYKNSAKSVNAISVQNLHNAVDIIETENGPVCADQAARQAGCVAANIFGEGNLSPAAIDYIIRSRQEETRYIRQDATAYVNGVVDHGVGQGLNILFGMDWRKEDSVFSGDAIEISDPGSGFPDILAVNGKYHVWSLFGEFKIPLIEEKAFFEKLELSGALRYSHYNLSGSVWSSATGINWKPVSDLRFRAQYQRSVREPAIDDLYIESYEGFPVISDPCARINIEGYGNIRDICLETGVPADLVGNYEQINPQVREISKGNTGLDIEKSDTFTAGLVYQPAFLPEMQLTMDYYHISLKNMISSFAFGASGIISSCYDENNSLAAACDKIFRNESGQLSYIDSSLTNLGAWKTSGVDAQLFYQKNLGQSLLGSHSHLELVFQASYLLDHELQQVGRKIDCAGFFLGGCVNPLPKFRFSQIATWGSEKVEFSLRWRHIGRIDNKDAAVAPVAVPSLKAKNYFDLYGQYFLGENVVVRAGVENIFNIRPDFVGAGQQQANSFPNIYDVLGPYFHLGINIRY